MARKRLLRPPAHLLVPDYARTNGDIAADVGAQLGMPPDAEQRLILDAIFAESSDATPACFEVAVIAPRQNLKTAALEIAALTYLFVFGEPLVVWTAHLFKTAKRAFEDMARMIDANPDFKSRCRPHRTANGDEAIELLTGEKLEFQARSKGGGRGTTGAKLFYDEALFLTSGQVGATMPTLATMPDAQVIYGSSAGLEQSGVLRGIRARGRGAIDGRLGYLEWCAPRTPCAQQFCVHLVGTKGCALDNRKLWRAANPTHGRRISESALARFRGAMPPEEFAREFLGWWEDPLHEAGAAIPAEAWVACLDRKSKFGPGPSALGVHITGDRQVAFIGAAGARLDGLGHVEIVGECRPHEALERLVALHKKRKAPVVIDPGSHAGSLVQPLESAGIEVVKVSLRDLTAACGAVYDAVTDKTLRHIGQPQLDAAVFGSTTRITSGDAWAWKGPAVTPLVSVTLALHGYLASTEKPSTYEDRGLIVL